MHFYQDKRGRWRWTIVARNGRKVAREAEGDGFATKARARRNFETAKRMFKAMA